MLIRDALFKAEQILHTGRVPLSGTRLSNKCPALAGQPYRLEAQILLADCLGISHEQIFMHPELRIAEGKLKKFRENCAFRARGMPVAYLTNHKEFFGLDFYVDERVLIPRPETEMLVEEVMLRNQMLNISVSRGQITICDIGTGSGCIAVALAKNIPRSRITAVDISGRALQVAAKNAKIHKVKSRIQFIKSNLMEKVSNRNFNFIVANLPYVSDSKVLDYEPKRALSGGKIGVKLFEKLFKQLAALKPYNLCLICEIGFGQRKAIQKLIKRYFDNVAVEWKRDLAGIDRVFIINF